MNDKIESSVKLVSVGCKLPHGLLLELKADDGASIRYTLKGANAARVIGGFGITENIPAEFMSEWFRKNAKHPGVAKGMIFIHAHPKGAEAMAKERSAEASGFERIDPVKAGMLRNEKGDDDKAAVALFNEQRAKNPDRNRQLQE